MKKIFSILLLFLFTGINGVYSSPAEPWLLKVKQSDGRFLELYLKGDEKVNWGKTIDGYILLRGEEDDFVYAIDDGQGGIMPSSIIAHNESERGYEELEFLNQIDKSLFFSKEQISIMNQVWDIKEDISKKRIEKLDKSNNSSELKIIVLLMEFQNLRFTYSRKYFDNLFNQVGFNLNGNQGSVRDYFDASLYRNLDLLSTVVGPITASNNYEIYGQSQSSGVSGARTLLMEGINAADPQINYADYANKSNYVDCVYMIYAGYASSGGSSNTIWPHRSRLLYPVLMDGVYISDYACSQEMNGSRSYPLPPVIGTICHEFSHVLGLADNYDTDYDNQGQAFHPGEWDLMSSGNYNNGGKCPPLWSTFQRSTLNFCKLEELITTGSDWKGNKTLPPLHQDNRSYKISFTQNEYFIIENRQKQGWDTYLPGHGMLIYHIDENVPGWNRNCANCNPNWMGYDIEWANYPNHSIRSGNTFPGTSNNTSFTDNTTPNSNSNQGLLLGRPIDKIKENLITGNISFNFGGSSINDPYINSTSISRLNHDSIYVSVSIIPNSSTITERGVLYSNNPNPVSTHNKSILQDNNNNFILPVQFDNDTIYIRAYVKDITNNYHYGEIIKLIRPCESINSFPYNHGFENNNDFDPCWNQEANLFLSNTWKVLNANLGSIPPSQGFNYAFLKTDSNNLLNRKLITNAFNLDVLSKPYLKFDYFLNQRGVSQEKIRIYYKTSLLSEWQLIKTISNSSNTWLSDSILLPNKSSTYYIAFEGIANYGYGIGIDNILVSESDISAFPLVQTLSSNNITDVEASINGNIISQGYTPITSRGVAWSINNSPTIEDNMQVMGSGLGNYIVNINGLIPNTIYYIRAFAKNQGLIAYGDELIIQTKCARINQFPYYHYSDNNDSNCVDKELGWSIIQGNQVINPYSGNNLYAFYSPQHLYSAKLILPLINLDYQSFPKLKFSYNIPTQSSDTLKVYYRIENSGNWILIKTLNNNTNSWVNDSIDLPSPSNNYYIGFEGITNNGGGVYLDNISIVALFQLPTINTINASLLTYNSIEVIGEVISSGLDNVIERGVCYIMNGKSPSIKDNKIVNGNGLGRFISQIYNLQPETKYNIRIYAKNFYGINYGQEYSITTPPIPILSNIISGSQELCYNSVTTPIQGNIPSGGNGIFTYFWLESKDGSIWNLASDKDFLTMQNYPQYRAFETSYFKRIVYSKLVSDTSNIVFKRVYPLTKGGNVFRNEDSVFSNQGVRMELRSSLGSILGWERRMENHDWSELFDKKDSVWICDFPETQGKYFYRARVKSGVCNEEISGEDWSYVKRLVGIDVIDNKNSRFIISPNPTKGDININYNSKDNIVGDIIVYDINGRIIKTIKNIEIKSGNNWISISPLETGSYMLVFKSNKYVFSHLIIKK